MLASSFPGSQEPWPVHLPTCARRSQSAASLEPVAMLSPLFGPRSVPSSSSQAGDVTAGCASCGSCLWYAPLCTLITTQRRHSYEPAVHLRALLLLEDRIVARVRPGGCGR